jgi:thiol-disulfide isomerase/thioredoxin
MNNNKFYIMVAEWCPYCKMAKDAIFQLTEKYFDKGNIDILEESTEEYKKLAVELQMFSIPSFVIVDENNKQVATWEGPREYYNLLEFYLKHTETEVLPEDAGLFAKPKEEIKND